MKSLLAIEFRKISRAPIGRSAAAAVLAVVALTSIGGYAAAVHSPHTDLGRKAASMLTSQDWDGYTALAALGVSVTMVLSAGIVMAWSVGREFSDGTIVGLFAIPAPRGSVAGAKVVACLLWEVLWSLP